MSSTNPFDEPANINNRSGLLIAFIIGSLVIHALILSAYSNDVEQPFPVATNKRVISVVLGGSPSPELKSVEPVRSAKPINSRAIEPAPKKTSQSQRIQQPELTVSSEQINFDQGVSPVVTAADVATIASKVAESTFEQPLTLQNTVRALPDDPAINVAARKNHLNDYLAAVQALLAKHQTYPLSARRRNIEGVVIMELKIGQSGELIKTELKQTAAQVLNRSAAEAIAKVGTFPSLPEELRPEITIAVPFEYQLRD